ncbi:MAG: type I-B CRISPR-associated endonuclease Cas1b [Armatimonadetes bacterium]|nr:type I-B CRISPR-associated endonuclease Cas1b [Armatimonadota bacterium]MDW8154308.1 type I-B CRISPR-associated endonuclease Cas1b [Armatimonadota bacterium]
MRRALYLMGGGTLSRKQNTLCLEREGAKRYVPVEQVLEIHVFGEVEFNKRLLEFLSQHEIMVHIYSYHGWYMGTFYPREHNNSGYLLLQQVVHYLDAEKRLDLARRFVFGAIQNLLHVLRYYQRRGKALEDILTALEGQLGRVHSQQGIEQLMQVEGQAREAYYRAFDRILEDPDFEFEERTRRPPRNRMNALLSFGNSLLYTAVLSEIYRTHLDPRIGFLHATNFRRFALNLDVAEVFKPILVDRTVLSLVQKRQIQARHFDEALGGLYLKEEGRRRFLEAWEERLGTTLHHRGLKRHVSYRTLIRLELYKLEKHLLGDREYRPFRTRW